MYSKGHAGLTLLLMSLIMLPFPFGENSLIIILLSTMLSTLPDVDLKWQRSGIPIHHRGFTHSVLFAIVAGFVFGTVFWYTHDTMTWVGLGFISGFMGVVSHMVGDALTYMPFKPLWPFDKREISFGVCSASDKSVNEGLMSVGSAAFILYILLKQGVISELLTSFI
jgi:inner membrane protein